MRFTDWKFPKIPEGKPNEYNWVVRHAKNFSMGFGTDIGAFTYINAENGVTIEDYVQIGSHCSLYSVSTIDNKQGSILLKKNCRIGTHSLIMPGITIGSNSRIGAFSFVTTDIPDNVLAYGIPAKVIRPLTAEEQNIDSEEDQQ